MVGLDVTDGEELWRRSARPPSASSTVTVPEVEPLVVRTAAGRDLVVVDEVPRSGGRGTVLVFDPSDGSVVRSERRTDRFRDLGPCLVGTHGGGEVEGDVCSDGMVVREDDSVSFEPFHWDLDSGRINRSAVPTGWQALGEDLLHSDGAPYELVGLREGRIA